MANNSDLFTTWPSCGASCFRQLLASTDCSGTQPHCFCRRTAFIQNALACSQQTCSNAELLDVEAFAKRACSVDVSSRPERFIIIVSVLCAMALLMVLIRLITWSQSNQRVTGWDNCLVVLSWALAFPLTITAGFFYKLGIGYDIWTFPQSQLSRFLLVAYVEGFCYVLATGVVKIAILVFLLRVFPSREFRHATFIVIGICVAGTLSFTAVCALQCLPVSYFWLKVYGDTRGSCIATETMVVHAVLNMALDFTIIVLPMPMLYKLRVNWNKKIQIMSMFSFGLILLAVCIIRLRLLIRNIESSNYTADYWELLLWDAVEAYTSIICVCLPAAKVLFERTFTSAATKKHASWPAWTPIHSTRHQRIAGSNEEPRSLSSGKQKVVHLAQRLPTFSPLPSVTLVHTLPEEDSQTKS